MHVHGQEQPVKPIECNFDERKIVQAYMSLFQEKGKAYKDEDDIDVAREEYFSGYTLFCFDMTPGLECDYFSLIKTGNARLGITFRTPLAQTINLIVYAEFQNVLEVDRNRNNLPLFCLKC